MTLRRESEGQSHAAASSVTCPSCAAQAEYIGAIPHSKTFAGRVLGEELEGGELWKCCACNLVFRHPRMTKDQIDRLYCAGSEDGWQTPAASRTDWNLIREWLAVRKGLKRILDVGCFDGRLLEFLGRDYEWMGIEIHAEAARRARARGVNVVSNDFGNLSRLNADVDVAMAVDVIEHSLDPRAFLASLAACVRPGGYVIVTTGNTEAPTWRLMGSRYWYCHIAEHMSFISPTWARHVAPRLGLEIEHVQLFSHGDGAASFKQRIYEASANLVLRFAPSLFALLRRFGVGGIDIARYPGLAFAPPYWMSAKDHMLVVFRKRSAP